MTSPSTSPELVHLLSESELLAPTHVSRIREQLSQTKTLKQDPKALAKALVKQCVLTSYQAKQLLAGQPDGFFIGQYRILDLLGEGGMGKVFLAEQTSMKRPVALKLLELTVFTDNSIAQRFSREARAGAKLRHPHLTQVYDFAQDCDRCYIAMEFIEGVSLQELVQKSGAVAYKQAAEFIRQASEGLQHAHETGLIHRDVKPGNLMVDTKGTVKILDLGLVSIPADADPLTLHQKDIVLGTADYVAPEQAMDPHNVDIRADIYSLGAVFYFLLTGTLPFPGKSIAKKLMAHQTLEPQPIREITPEVPRKLQAIVQKMMAKDPNDRYQTPREVARAVKIFATEVTPPYDLSLVRYSHSMVEKYIKFGGGDPTSSDRLRKPTRNRDSSASNNGTPTKPKRKEAIQPPHTVPQDPKVNRPTPNRVREPDLEAVTDTDAGPRTLAMIRSGRKPEREFQEEYEDRRDTEPPRVKKKPKKSQSSKVLAVCLAAGGSILAIGIVVAGIILSTLGTPEKPKAVARTSVGRPKHIALNNHNSPDAIKKVIHKIRKNGRIVLHSHRGGWHADNLVIARNRLPNNGEFTLAGQGSNVVLVRRDNGPIISVRNANRFVLENVILDGQGRYGPLVEITGNAAGVVFRNVTIRNVNGTAVRFISAQAKPGQPIRFINTTFVRSRWHGTTGVAFQSNGTTDRTSHVEFVGCRFVGKWKTAMLFGQPVGNVTIRDSVFSGPTRGIRFAPMPLQRRRGEIKPIATWRVSRWWDDDKIPTFSPARAPTKNTTLAWKSLRSNNGHIDLIEKIGKANNQSVLAYHKFVSKTPGMRRIFVGCDDEAVIWVNGKKVFEHLGHQGCMAQEFTTVASFRRGPNHIWAKVKNGKSASGFIVHVAKDYLPLTTPDWRNITIRNNTFENTDRAITVAAAPTQETLIRVIQNQFRRNLHYPVQVLKSKTEPLRAGTIVAGNNSDAQRGPHVDQTTDALAYHLVSLR